MCESGRFGPFNLGTPREVTMRELAGVVVEVTGSSSEVVLVEAGRAYAEEPRRRCPDTRRAAALGWEPLVGLEEGLALTAAAFAAEGAESSRV